MWIEPHTFWIVAQESILIDGYCAHITMNVDRLGGGIDSMKEFLVGDPVNC